MKFRYCYYCKKPVTKQNFRSRHLHADLQKLDEVDGKVTSVKRNNKSSSVRIKADKPDGVADQVPVSERPPKTDRPSKKPRLSTATTPAEPMPATADRCQRWSSLLTKRPRKLSEMNGWLSEVIAVSDPMTGDGSEENTSVDCAGSPGAPPTQQSQWDKLLERRPGVSGSHRSCTDWMVDVLKLSCPEFESAKAQACVHRAETCTDERKIVASAFQEPNGDPPVPGALSSEATPDDAKTKTPKDLSSETYVVTQEEPSSERLER